MPFTYDFGWGEVQAYAIANGPDGVRILVEGQIDGFLYTELYATEGYQLVGIRNVQGPALVQTLSNTGALLGEWGADMWTSASTPNLFVLVPGNTAGVEMA
ncbi:hypothetical protein RZS08_37045, partial [Arthrospira platensis SPKY1]|nr:hypothetical protein [Arthrospira platensis SPKY1]